MQLSSQAMGAIMMALQESVLSQSDIVPVLKGCEREESEDGLVITNPPSVRFTEDTEMTAEDIEAMAER